MRKLTRDEIRDFLIDKFYEKQDSSNLHNELARIENEFLKCLNEEQQQLYIKLLFSLAKLRREEEQKLVDYVMEYVRIIR